MRRRLVDRTKKASSVGEGRTSDLEGRTNKACCRAGGCSPCQFAGGRGAISLLHESRRRPTVICCDALPSLPRSRAEGFRSRDRDRRGPGPPRASPRGPGSRAAVPPKSPHAEKIQRGRDRAFRGRKSGGHPNRGQVLQSGHGFICRRGVTFCTLTTLSACRPI